MKKNDRIICCENAGEKKTIEANCAKYFKEVHFEFMSPDTATL